MTILTYPSPNFLCHVGPPVVVASFMRSGTHLAIDSLRANFNSFSSWKYPLEKNSRLYADLDVYLRPVKFWQQHGLRARLIRPRRPIFKCHWGLSGWSTIQRLHPQLSDWIESQGRIVLVVRDPRKILLSNIAWDVSISKDPSSLDLPHLAISLIAKLERRWHSIINCNVAPIFVLDASQLLVSPLHVLEELSTFLEADMNPNSPVLPAPLASVLKSRMQRLFATQPESTAIITRRRPTEFTWLLETDVVRSAHPICS